MKDVYVHPTVTALAAALRSAPQRPDQGDAAPVEEVTSAGTARYVLFGVAQLLIFLGSVHLGMLVLVSGLTWVAGSAPIGDHLARSAGLAFGLFLLACVVPILAKWLLVGRWKRQEIPLWGLTYLRFWFVTALGTDQPAGAVRRFPALRAVPAGTRRTHRTGRRGVLAAGARLH